MKRQTVWICTMCSERIGPCVQTQEERPSQYDCIIGKGDWRAATKDEIEWYA